MLGNPAASAHPQAGDAEESKADALLGVGISGSFTSAAHSRGVEEDGEAAAPAAGGTGGQQLLTHSQSMPCVASRSRLSSDSDAVATPRPAVGRHEAAAAVQEASGWQSDTGQGSGGGRDAWGGSSGRRASSSGGGDLAAVDDDLMAACKQYPCTWTRLTEAKDRRALLMKSRKLMRVLREINNKLVEVSPGLRQRELQCALERVNDRLPPGLYIPLLQGRYPLFYILLLLPNEARVFSTNKRAPFLCVAEIDVVQAPSGVREAWRSAARPSDEAGREHAGGRHEPSHACASPTSLDAGLSSSYPFLPPSLPPSLPLARAS